MATNEVQVQGLGERLVVALGLDGEIAGEGPEVAGVLADLLAEKATELLDEARVRAAGRRLEAERAARTPEDWEKVLERFGLVPVALRWPRCPLPEESGAAGGTGYTGASPAGRPPAFRGVPRDTWDRRYWDLRPDGVYRCKSLRGLEQEAPVCSPIWPTRVTKDGAAYAVKGATGWREVLVPAGTAEWPAVVQILVDAGLKLAGPARWVDPAYSEADPELRHPADLAEALLYLFLQEHQAEAPVR